MIDFEFEFQYSQESTPTLRKVSGNIPAGRCVVLCGGSGCGKSTLLRCINGLIPQFYEGELTGFCRLDGHDTADLSIGEIGELAASVFQDPRSQFFTVNSSNEVAFGLENHGLPQEKIRNRVDEAFRTFHLEHLKNRNVYELSSGERQLISILSAWAMDTDIFLLDEPTANLDFAATQQLRNILLKLKKQGKTLLLSEHRLYYLADIADEYWIMANGEIKHKYTAEKAKSLSPLQLHTLSLRTLDLEQITVSERPPQPENMPQALFVSDLRYEYGRKNRAILSDVNFSVCTHEIVGLVGANGCGKTTLGKLIAGLYHSTGGEISLFGKAQKPKQLQKQVLFIMQEAEFQFFTNSVLHELQYGHKITDEFEKKTETLLKSMDMWECRDRHPFSLSGGQMQRLTLMMAYLSDKPIIILDEPTAGQDADSLKRCAELIREMGKEKTVLIITHDLELIADACDRCIGLCDGHADTEFFIRSQQDLQAVRRYMECFHPTKVSPPKQYKERFHPATKLLYWLVLTIVISTSDNHLVYAAYAALMLLTAADGRLITALFGSASFGALWAANVLLPDTLFSFILVLFPRIIAIGISMMTLIGRNEASRTLAALRNMHLPERFIMIVAVIFRFFPVLSGDMKLLRQSIRTRGAFVTLWQKLRALPSYIEILTVPMALRVIRIAETLSASAETRGIDLKRRKSNFLSLRFSAWDILFFVVLTVSVVVGLIL
ncbi:MAG: ATP-binding cassette domain-containing protein [[Eubacterium] siraeum]